MRCGNCTGDHATVAEVKECYTHGPKEATPPAAVTTKEAPQWPASDPQKAYITGLLRERTLPDGYVPPDMDTLEKDVASDTIRFLKTLAKKPLDQSKAGKPVYENIIAGRYALANDGIWKFYEVQLGKGRWTGYTFIKQLIGAPGHYKKIDVSRFDRDDLLRRIDADVQRAMEDYGKESGICGKCSSPLTDPVSLERGIGPVCYSKLGW